MRTSGTSIGGTAKDRQVAMATEQPYLVRLDPESIRIFLRKYDAYCGELKARASQLVQEGLQSLEPIRPVGLVYCIDSEPIHSAVELALIDGCTNSKDLTDEQLRALLKKESVDSATIVTESDLSQMVQKHDHMDMAVKSASDRMKLLFMEYRSFLRQHGMRWVVKDNKKISTRHVFSVIKSAQLRTRMDQDLSFSKRSLKDNFAGFMNH